MAVDVVIVVIFVIVVIVVFVVAGCGRRMPACRELFEMRSHAISETCSNYLPRSAPTGRREGEQVHASSLSQRGGTSGIADFPKASSLEPERYIGGTPELPLFPTSSPWVSTLWANSGRPVGSRRTGDTGNSHVVLGSGHAAGNGRHCTHKARYWTKLGFVGNPCHDDAEVQGSEPKPERARNSLPKSSGSGREPGARVVRSVLPECSPPPALGPGLAPPTGP